MTRRLLPLVLVALVAQACFASKSDFEALRADVAATQRRAAATDSLQRVQIAQLVSLNRAIGALGDSIRSLRSRIVSSSAVTASEMNGLKQDVARLQDLTGQSEQRMKEIRATLEEHAPTLGRDSISGAGPGPAQLLQLGRDQMLKRSYGAGRDALNDLLTRFPASDLAPDAAFEIAQSFRAENNLGAADSAYADFASRYPGSAKVPSVLYKRGLILQSLGRQSEAKRLFEEVRRRFPRSSEALLAAERLGGAR